MRIAYFADAPRIGGAERWLAEAAAGSHAAGHVVTVLSPGAELLDYVQGIVPGIDVQRTTESGHADARTLPGRMARIAAQHRPLRHAFKQLDAELLHVNNGGYPGSEICRIAALAAPSSMHRVMTVHAAPQPREHAYPRLQALVDRRLWPRLDAVIGGTAFVGDSLARLREMPPALYERIPYGMPEPTSCGAAELRARLAPGGEVLAGMVSATDDPEKGHAVFAEALARAGEGVRGVIVGRAPTGIADGEAPLSYEGFVEDPGPYMHAIDLLVVPSTSQESLPLVVVEAMAAAKPVFASRLSGIPEAVAPGRTGELFEPGSVEQLARLLADAVAQRKRLSQLGAAGRETWAEEFSPEVMQVGLQAVYDRLASGSPR